MKLLSIFYAAMFIIGINTIPIGQGKVKVYTVYWCVGEEIPTGCPDGARVDKYGRKSTMPCLAYHYRVETTCDSSIYINRKEAYEFYTEAKIDEKRGGIYGMKGISRVRIDSMYRDQ